MHWNAGEHKQESSHNINRPTPEKERDHRTAVTMTTATNDRPSNRQTKSPENRSNAHKRRTLTLRIEIKTYCITKRLNISPADLRTQYAVISVYRVFNVTVPSWSTANGPHKSFLYACVCMLVFVFDAAVLQHAAHLNEECEKFDAIGTRGSAVCSIHTNTNKCYYSIHYMQTPANHLSLLHTI